MADESAETPAGSLDTSAEAEAAPAGEEAARFRLRSAGHCAICDRIVEREADGSCPKGHPAELVSGDIRLAAGEPIPALPRFNIAAFALPPVWGPAHGQWVGVLFLPIWLFADSVFSTAGRGTVALVGAIVVGVLTLAFQAFFAKRANGVAWRHVAGRVSVEEFVRRERIWALSCVPLGMALLGWALYYRFVLA